MLREDLEEHYPTLHVSIVDDNTVRVSGMFPVRDADGGIIDRYQVQLDLPADYPRSLPVVYETGGRVSWTEDRHVNTDGTACVMMPEERRYIWPMGQPLSQYLDGPLRNFFLGQLARDHGDPWPFGEWAHGEAGFHQFVQDQIGTSDPIVIGRFLCLVQDEQVSYKGSCPCGSSRRTRDCCRSKVVELRRLISRESATRLLVWLATTPTVKELQRVSGTATALPSWRMQRKLLMASTSIPTSTQSDAA
jgi:hypothetical protein